MYECGAAVPHISLQHAAAHAVPGAAQREMVAAIEKLTQEVCRTSMHVEIPVAGLEAEVQRCL